MTSEEKKNPLIGRGDPILPTEKRMSPDGKNYQEEAKKKSKDEAQILTSQPPKPIMVPPTQTPKTTDVASFAPLHLPPAESMSSIGKIESDIYEPEPIDSTLESQSLEIGNVIPLKSTTRKAIAEIINMTIGMVPASDQEISITEKMLEESIVIEKLQVLQSIADEDVIEMQDFGSRELVAILASSLLFLRNDFEKSNNYSGLNILNNLDVYEEPTITDRMRHLVSLLGTQHEMFPDQPFNYENSKIWFASHWGSAELMTMIKLLYKSFNQPIAQDGSIHNFLFDFIAKINSIREIQPLKSQDANALLHKITSLLTPSELETVVK